MDANGRRKEIPCDQEAFAFGGADGGAWGGDADVRHRRPRPEQQADRVYPDLWLSALTIRGGFRRRSQRQDRSAFSPLAGRRSDDPAGRPTTMPVSGDARS